MALEIKTLFSGSTGNSAIVSYNKTTILIDAGSTCKNICEKLNESGHTPDEIKAILITHEHSDHISALKVLTKKLNASVFVPGRCLEKVSKDIQLSVDIKPICDKGEFTVGEIKILPFRVPHDSLDCFGYFLTCGEDKIAITTDVGKVSDGLKELLKQCNYLIIEANHDIDMVKNGSYAYDLKQRILSGGGHLSNRECAKLVTEIASCGNLKAVTLAHLSEENNTPELAEKTVCQCLNGVKVIAAQRHSVTEFISKD